MSVFVYTKSDIKISNTIQSRIITIGDATFDVNWWANLIVVKIISAQTYEGLAKALDELSNYWINILKNTNLSPYTINKSAHKMFVYTRPEITSLPKFIGPTIVGKDVLNVSLNTQANEFYIDLILPDNQFTFSFGGKAS